MRLVHLNMHLSALMLCSERNAKQTKFPGIQDKKFPNNIQKAEEWEVPKALPFHLGVCLDVCGGFPLPLLQYLFIIVVYNSQVHSFCNSTFGPLSKTPAGSNLFVRQMLIN